MKKSVALPALSVCFIFAESALCAQSVSTSADLAAAFNNGSSSSITIASDITAADYLNSRASDITLNGSSGILTLNGYKFVFMPNWNDGLSADISNMQIAGATSGAIELGGDGQGDHNYTISGSNFTNNKNSQNGGAIYSHAQSHGGVRNYVFTGNVFNLNSAANGGALYNASNNSQMPVFFNITGGSFNANSAINGNGGAIYNATNYGSGSGLNNGFTIGTQANKILFTNNSAPVGYGGAIYNFVNNPSSGGTSEINIFGDFQGNSAANGGSVVNHVEGGNGSNSVSVGIGGNFSGNSAGNNGGAVANYVGLSGNAPYGGLNIFDFTYADFTNNAAGTDGGAIYNYFNSGGSSGQVNVGGNGILFS
ncbi:MAG: hypothetical protein LBG46_02290, partial [Elusimicrobiota bacterium]|nr:hypothetical protein [Elusimicrobiota bacterium]